MSHKHQQEFELWKSMITIDTPQSLVYVKSHHEQWFRSGIPMWEENNDYIVDNEYAQLRMDAIDSDSEIEYQYFDTWLPIRDIYGSMARKLNLRLKPKDEPKSELDVLKEKYATNDYILLFNFQDLWFRWDKIETLMLPRHKLIHKRHEDVLYAYLADNSVDIEFWHRLQKWSSVEADWLVIYKETDNYRLKPKQQDNPKTKIVKEWLCYNNAYYTKISEFEPLFAMQVLREIEVPNV